MIYQAKKELKFKSGLVIPVGGHAEVKPVEGKPWLASITYGIQFTMVRSLKLWKYFKGFKKPAANFGIYNDSAVPSLTGEMVEPDGYDSKGWPSMLVAGGFI